MSKSAKYSLFFFLIFLLGIIAMVAYINQTLNKKAELEMPAFNISITTTASIE